MNSKSLIFKQVKKQFNIFSKLLSRITMMNYIKIIMINKVIEKDSVINTAELQITVNFTIHKMIAINYEALKKACTINTAEL